MQARSRIEMMRMHVALVGIHPPPGQCGRGGVERVVETLRRKLAEKVRVSLIAPYAPEQLHYSDEYGEISYIKRMPGPGFLGYCTLTSMAIQREIERLKPDVIHVHDMAGFALMWPRRGSRQAPMVFTAHGVLEKDVLHDARSDLPRRVTAPIRSFFMGTVERMCRKLYDEIIVINDYVLEAMPQIAAMHHHSIVNPIDQIFFDAPPAPHRIGPGVHLLQVGVVNQRKSVLSAIELTHELILRGVGAHLHVVGPVTDDRYYGECIEAISQREIERAVTFHGGASPHEVAAWMDRADLLVLLSKQETSPMVVAEAHCRGLPVAVPRAFGFRSMVCEGKDGIFLGEGSPADDAALVESFLSGSIDRDAICKEARDKYDLESIIGQTLAVYRKALGRNPSDALECAVTTG